MSHSVLVVSFHCQGKRHKTYYKSVSAIAKAFPNKSFHESNYSILYMN